MADGRRTGSPPSLSLRLVRYGLPVALAIAGVVLMVIGHGRTRSTSAATGLVLVGIGVIAWMVNWMFRMSIESNRDREKEEEARDYFSKHGHWPGEGD